ncbi:MAG: type I-C CRISPR-associated protein Cas8c/Csd1 [Lentisphaerae bacterium]|nr:type I-C CRISPR-associated protein Cas8c/Csd1 [Lentisphaerota bacterium]OQC15986.1 MAG: CRISPR-associated protein (Cas_Csd1) [Lentisphaerae bacterium ADurb.Bin082]HQL86822.1 type I-C CRISPR-associated protein Cas8c/Csd1 [Lentisphaeria bacterium]
MILQALKEYYDRKAADPDGDIAPLGWEKKELPFLVVIDMEGVFLRFEDTRDFEGKSLRAKRFLVPSLGEAKGSGIKSNLLWENAEYMFGIPIRETSKAERIAKQHEAFKGKILSLASCPNSGGALAAVQAFITKIDLEKIKADPLWPEVEALNQSLLLSISGVGPVTDILEIRDAVNHVTAASIQGNTTLCLVSGNQDVMSTLEPPIRGVQGASTMGAHLVAVNNKVSESGNGGATPAFASFMKEQGANSPIGKTASLAYTTALNTLLGRDSRQKLQVGDATTVFWSSRQSAFEDDFGDFFAEPPKDDPDRLTNAVATLYNSIDNGTLAVDSGDTRFYVLGLAPNAARIAVRFWHSATVQELALHICAYFEDLRIAHGKNDKEDLSLWRLLVSTAVQGKSENIAPNLAGETMRRILTGLPLPETLLQAALLRIKAERDVTYPRAKLIKGCLNRKSKERKITVSLDKQNPNVGYRLGRLFAVLEKIQQEANPGINATIRDRFYASASSAPLTVFGNLMRLKNHHLSKLENTGRRIWFERLLGEIVSDIPDFPAHLTLDDQGRFAIGYYHQAQALWTKKSDKEENV